MDMHYAHAGAVPERCIKLRSGAPGEAKTTTPPPNSSPFGPIPHKQGGAPSHASLEPYVPAEIVLAPIQPLLRFGPLLRNRAYNWTCCTCRHVVRFLPLPRRGGGLVLGPAIFNRRYGGVGGDEKAQGKGGLECARP